MTERGPEGTWGYLAFWDNGVMALEETLGWLPCSDVDASLLIMGERSGKIHYVPMLGIWHVWDGRCHRPDEAAAAAQVVYDLGLRLRLMIRAARSAVMARVALSMPADVTDAVRRRAFEMAWEPWRAGEKYAAGLLKSAGASSLVKVLGDTVAVAPRDFDEKHPREINFVTGTVSAETLQQRWHDPGDMITYTVPVAWNPYADAPMFWRMLCRMVGNDGEVAAYVLKVLGYCLLGENPERKIFFIAGPTSSGKSQILHIVSRVLGALAHSSLPDLICVSRHGRNARVENSVRGKRLVTITEFSGYRTIEESQVKRLTGEPVISVNEHYAKQEIETAVTFTIVCATNEMPELTRYDAGMQERVVVIPGGPTLPEWERDPRLPERIIATEAEGIMALLMKGCAEYERSGLEPPLAVRLETDRYKGRQDTVANFIRDCCLVGVRTGWAGELPSIGMADAFRIYRDWSHGSSRLGREAFHDEMSRQPGVTRVDNGGSTRRYEGIVWNEDIRRMHGV